VWIIVQIWFLRNNNVCIEPYSQRLVEFPPFGRYNNYIVPRSCPPYAGGRCVLKYRYVFDIMGIDVVYVPFINEIVKDDQRIQGAVDGT